MGFSVFGDRNDVNVNGPAAAGGALFQSDQTVSQTGPGIEINEAAPPPGGTTNLLATGNKFAPKTFANGNVNRSGSQLSGSLTKAGKQFKQFSSSLNQISKRLNDSVQKALSGFGKKKQASEPETERADDIRSRLS